MSNIIIALISMAVATIITNLIKMYMPKVYRIMEYFNWNTWAYYMEGAGHGTAAIFFKGFFNFVAYTGLLIIGAKILQTIYC